MRTSPSSSEATERLLRAVGAALERALTDSLDDWHLTAADGCKLDLAAAARVAARALSDLLVPDSAGGHDPEQERVTLRNRIERLEQLAEAIRAANVWDHSVYGEHPDSQWLAIDRVHYQNIVHALAQVDTWRPWQRRLEARLGDV